MSIRHPLQTLAAGLALTLGAAGARAQDLVTLPLSAMPLAPAGSEGGSIGLGLASGPRYLGGSENHLQALPLLGYQWANGWFASTTQGVGVNLSSSSDLQYGPRLTLDPGRRERGDDALNGMGRVRPSLEGGGFVNFRVAGDLWLNTALRAGAGEDHRGARFDVDASYAYELSPGLRVRLGAGATLANRAWAQTRFGVTAAQSASSGYASYTPGGGLQDLHASAGLSYTVAPRVTLSAGLLATRLGNDAQDSPLARKTSQLNGIFGVSYGF